MLHRARHRNGGAGPVRLHNQTQPVGQRGLRDLDEILGNLEPRQRDRRPRGQFDRLGRGRSDLLRAAKALVRDGLPGRHRLQNRRNRVLIGQVFLGNPVYIRQRNALDRLDVFIGRVAALGGQRIRPEIGQAGNRVALKLGRGHFAADRRRHKILRDAHLRIVCQNRPHFPDGVLGGARGLRARGQSDHPVADAGLGMALRQAELRRQRLAGRDHSVQVGALAGQHIGQNLAGRVIRRTGSRQPIGDKAEKVGKIAVERELLRLDRLQIDGRPRGQGVAGHIAELPLNLGQRRGRVHIAHHHQDGVAWRVPLLVKILEHLARGGVERALRAQRIVGVGSTHEHILIQAIHEFVGGVGEVARHLLLDGAALRQPLLLGVVDAVQAGRLRFERHVQVGRWHGGKVLGNVLLRVGVVFASQLRINRRRLIGRHARAAAKGHVLLRVGHARKSRRRLVAAHQKIRLHGDHRS